MLFLELFRIFFWKSTQYSKIHLFLHKLYSGMFQDSHHNMLKFELSSEGLSLANLFTRMEQAQNDSGLKLEDYSISQNNLDNVSEVILP